MKNTIRRVEYYYTILDDVPGEAYRVLRQFAAARVSLLAFNVIPLGMDKTQIVVFPDVAAPLARAAERLGLTLAGPQHAFLIQGDDELGALVELHHGLADARINVLSSSAVSDGRGGFGYVLYVRAEDYERAAQVMGV